MTAAHPRQPVVLDAVGTARFKENAIVRHLLNNGGLDLNHLHTLDFSDADWEQFVQLIGYSVGGTVNMDYVSTDLWNAAQAEAEALIGAPAPTTCPDCGTTDCAGGMLCRVDSLIADRKAQNDASVRLYGCHNKPRPTAETKLTAQVGWRNYDPDFFNNASRLPILVDVPHRMSTTCQYDKSATDVGCRGCRHGEQP